MPWTKQTKTVRVIADSAGERCIEFFQRPDGTFGFEEYERVSKEKSSIKEDWKCVGDYDVRVFDSEDNAMTEALDNIPWFQQSIFGRTGLGFV